LLAWRTSKVNRNRHEAFFLSGASYPKPEMLARTDGRAKTLMNGKLKMVQGSGNVFLDLGFSKTEAA